MTDRVATTKRNSNRKVLLGIFGIPVLIIGLSSFLYYLVDSKAVDLGTVNNGELIVPPLQFAELPLGTLKSETYDYAKPEPKWSFVVVGDAACNDDCERVLYIARQSIIAMAKKMGRLRLLYVSTDGQISSELQQRIEEQYKGITVLHLSEGQLQDFFADTPLPSADEKRFYVVDPRGWMMMYYQLEDVEQETLNTLGKAIVRDMKRLIK